MLDDEFDEESDTTGPLHPDDRLWRHPSEVGATATLAGSRHDSTPHTSSPRIWAVALLAALTGASVAVGVLAMTGGLDRESTAQAPVSVRSIATAATGTQFASNARSVASKTSAQVSQVSVLAAGIQRHGFALTLRSDGALLTSAALVLGADSISVKLPNGRITDGSLIGSDSMTGLAVIDVELTGLPVPAVDDLKVAPGDDVVVATGAEQSTVSWLATGTIRSLNGRATSGGQPLVGMIETNSPTPTDADGSALVSDQGQLIGMCLAVDAKDQSTGYAVPIDVARAVATDILTLGHARKTWLGVEGDDLSAARSQLLGLSGGALLTAVMPDSPADEAGLKIGDAVSSLDGRPVQSMADMIGLLPLYRPGDTVELTVTRSGVQRSLGVTLGERS